MIYSECAGENAYSGTGEWDTGENVHILHTATRN